MECVGERSSPTAARGAVRVGVTTFVVVVIAAMLPLLAGAYEPADLLVTGDAGPSAAVIRQDFGAAALHSGTGFDGQQVYAIAREFPDLRAAAPHLLPARYRLLRIVQPAIASVGGQGAPVVVLLMLLGIAGCALAAGAVADLAAGVGMPPGAGYLVVAPLLPSVLVSTNEPLATGLGLLAVALAARRRVLAATVVMCLAVLTKESSLALAAGASIGMWRLGRRTDAIAMSIVPTLIFAAWAAYLAHAVGGDLPARFAAFDVLHLDVTTSFVVAATVLACVGGAIAWRRSPLVWPGMVLFAASCLVLTREVYGEVSPWFGVPRLASPAIGLAIAGVATVRRSAVPVGASDDVIDLRSADVDAARQRLART